MEEFFDIIVIGGGINGCGIARDAAYRGYSVCLLEKGDIASGTSSGSTKLIHGGLRYLESFQFNLVRKSLIEREVLLKIAPHIIWPLNFVLPHSKKLRPVWMLKIGMLLYDNLGGRKLLPKSSFLNNPKDEVFKPLKPQFQKAFKYPDCWADDARLVVLNAVSAAQKGAHIRSYTQVTKAEYVNDKWIVSAIDNQNYQKPSTTEKSGTTINIKLKANILINAAGPWANNVLDYVGHSKKIKKLRLVKGSHIIVPKIFKHKDCYIFQNYDQRIIFAIPFENDFTLIGSTDIDYTGIIDNCKISPPEIDYLCTAVNSYFREQITAKDVVWAYAAVRPLIEDKQGRAQDASRDYEIVVEKIAGKAALISILGGKLTTYRKLAEAVLDKVDQLNNKKNKAITGHHHLPGGDFPVTGFGDQLKKIKLKYNFISDKTLSRLVRSYGTQTEKILKNAKNIKDLGINFGADLYESEVRYLFENEFAKTAEDIIWRRTKIGLHLNDEKIKFIDKFLKNLQSA